jgi:hypothetical protein
LQAAFLFVFFLRGGAVGAVCPAQQLEQRIIPPLPYAAAENQGALCGAVFRPVEELQLLFLGQAVQAFFGV